MHPLMCVLVIVVYLSLLRNGSKCVVLELILFTISQRFADIVFSQSIIIAHMHVFMSLNKQ